VLSGLGEKLDARVPLKAREGEWFHASCLSLTRDLTKPTLPGLADGTLSVERRRDSANLRVRTATPVNDPAFAFGVTSTCAGASQPVTGEVVVLLDPPRPGMPAPTQVAKGPARAIGAPPAPVERTRMPARAAPVRSAPAEPAPAASPAPERAAAAPPPPAAPRAASGSQFVLRLSSDAMDLSRTQQFDDKKRAVLRERLRLLDQDDQVAAMLSMQDNLKRLEARVAELQLRLASMPASFPTAPTPAAPTASKAAPTVATAAPQPVGAAPARPAPEAPKVESAAPKAEPPAPAAAPTKAASPEPSKAEAPAISAAPEAARKLTPEPVEKVVGALESFQGRLIAAGLVLFALLVLLGGWLWMRFRHPAAAAGDADVDDGDATVMMEHDPHTVMMDAGELASEQPIEIAAPPVERAAIASDTSLATRLQENTENLRRRYIEERFPEIRGGTIVLDDPGSVVKGARLFYEDGAMPRAVELLRFAIEDRPEELRPWLALFEIYRLERISGEYAELAGRFRDRHGATEWWPKVQAFGREIDPGNALYQEPPMKSLETIGPREARRLAAAANIDPIAENWLEAPMDFENEVLATELRRSLMARASVDERDLVPNPMPALRSIEMFSVG
jgi:hypothetical protein